MCGVTMARGWVQSGWLFGRGSGSVTILAVTTMPGNDVTHPVPDTTGYITEGQLYLHDGMIDPFGSLSRLKQHVIGQRAGGYHADDISFD